MPLLLLVSLLLLLLLLLLCWFDIPLLMCGGRSLWSLCSLRSVG